MERVKGKMKRSVLLAAAVVLAAGLAGCAAKGQEPDKIGRASCRERV